MTVLNRPNEDHVGGFQQKVVLPHQYDRENVTIHSEMQCIQSTWNASMATQSFHWFPFTCWIRSDVTGEFLALNLSENSWTKITQRGKMFCSTRTRRRIKKHKKAKIKASHWNWFLLKAMHWQCFPLHYAPSWIDQTGPASPNTGACAKRPRNKGDM